MNRRVFLQQSGRATLGLAAAGGVLTQGVTAQDLPAPDTLSSGAFWKQVQALYATPGDFINLEYGYFCPSALPVLDAEVRSIRQIHRRASYYKRNQMVDDLERSRAALAGLAGVDPGEVAITRNATESMNVILQGVDLQPGEELVYSDQDYGSMIQAIEQKADRFGVVAKQVSLPLHPSSDEEIVQCYADAIGPHTRLLHVTHMINLTGQVLPVSKICDMAHDRGVEVAVDAAHSFAHIDFKVSELGCDYLGTSLHKWLCSPMGLGMLYVKKEKIPQVWPLLGDSRRARDDIRKLERVGTRPDQHVVALQDAIQLHQKIGAMRKQERLQSLQQRWVTAVSEIPGVRILTPSDPSRHGAIGCIAVDGVEPETLTDYWFQEYGIFTVPIQHPVVKGVRVTPGVGTPNWHVDRFVTAVEAAVTTLG